MQRLKRELHEDTHAQGATEVGGTQQDRHCSQQRVPPQPPHACSDLVAERLGGCIGGGRGEGTWAHTNRGDKHSSYSETCGIESKRNSDSKSEEHCSNRLTKKEVRDGLGHVHATVGFR